jgi:hypothetical protein
MYFQDITSPENTKSIFKKISTRNLITGTVTFGVLNETAMRSNDTFLSYSRQSCSLIA